MKDKFGKYPMPHPDEKNGNSSHGSSPASRKGGSRGTMSNNGKGGTCGHGGGKSRKM